MYSQIGIYSVAAVTFIVMNIYRQIWALIDRNCIRIERCGWQRERRPALSFGSHLRFMYLQISSSYPTSAHASGSNSRVLKGQKTCLMDLIK